MDAPNALSGRPVANIEHVLITAIVLITSALVLYTTGIWTEHRAGVLRPIHAALFGAGLTFDSTGTFTMSLIAKANPAATGALGQVMIVTGALALILMAAHLTWAVVVLLRRRPAELATFHRFSLVVWAIWLIPYVTGALSAR